MVQILQNFSMANKPGTVHLRFQVV